MSAVPRWLVLVYSVLLLALGVGGSWFYRDQERQERQGAKADLESIARTKVEQIVQWRAERLGDAAVLVDSPLFGEAVRRLLANPGSGDAEKIMDQFRAMREHFPYQDILLLEAGGRVVLRFRRQDGDLPPAVTRVLEAARRAGRPMVSDLFQQPGARSPQVMIAAPLRAGPTANEAPVGMVLLRVDAEDFLYPVTQSWPTPTRTGEALFVRRDGDDVLFLNPLRHDSQAAFKLRIPLTRGEVPSVQAVLGREGVVEGRDYQGIPVLAALRAVPDSPWYLITKIDAAEALEDWHTRAALIMAVLVLLAGALGGTIAMIWQQRGKYQALAAAAAALREHEGRLRDVLGLNEKLLGAAPVGIQVFKSSGQCVQANETAAQTVGGRVESLLRQNFREIPSWRPSGLFAAAVQTLATRVPQRLEISIQTTFGRALWLDCSLTSFESANEQHLLLVFSDVTERKQSEALRTQLSTIIETSTDFVATASPQGQFRYFNRTARRLFGLGDDDDPCQHRIAQSHPTRSAQRVLEEGIPAAIRDGTWAGETEYLTRDGREIPHTQVITAHPGPDGAVALLSIVARDISERKRNEELLQARLRLLEAAPTAPLERFLQLTLDEIEARTGSTIGFYHFMDTDQETLTLQAWSTNTVRHLCTAEGQGSHYPISKAGVWVDCVRERRPVIHNDYAALDGKKGLPEGHAPILRELVVPILRHDQIVAIIGVGNKPGLYGQAEIEIATLLGDISWEIVERKRAEIQLHEVNRLQEAILNGAELGIVSATTEGRITTFSTGAEKLLGYAREAMIGLNTPLVYHLPNEIQARANELTVSLGEPVAADCAVFAALPRRGQPDEREWTLVRKDGSLVPVSQSITALRDAAGAITGFLCIARNLTERKKADVALRASEDRLRKVLGQADCLVWEARVQLTADDWSWRFTIHPSGLYFQLFGDQEPNQSAGLWYQFKIPEQAEMNRRSRAAMESGRPGYMQLFQVERDGQTMWVRESVSISLLETGVFWLVGVATDITEQKRADRALVASEQRLRLATETAELGIWDWDLARNVVAWDPQMYRFYGLPLQAAMQVAYQDWAGTVLPEDLAEQERILQATARGGGRSEREFRIRRASDGQIRHIHAAEICVTDDSGRPVRVVGVNRDITERKQEEEALAQEAERRRVLFEQSQDGIVVLDLGGRVVELNQSFANLLGYSMEEAQQLHIWDWDSQWTKEELLEKLAALAKIGATFETHHRRKNGMQLDVEVSSGGVKWRGRTLVFAVHREISLRKLLEARQRKLLDELSRSNTDLEQFAYVASHDLKSPLRAIDSLAGWLQEDLANVLVGDSRKHLDLLRHRTHRMERLLDDLLAYSRAGRVPADIVRTDTSRLLAEIVEMISPPPGFTVTSVPTLPVFATAVTPLRQVITNLIANAIKHHDRPSGAIELSARRVGERYEFTIADDGPGIPPEFHERIFGMFQTLRPRDEVEGSGIGLALVRRIVARYGGTVTVECPPPRGSRFCFTWPQTISTDDSQLS